MNPRRLGLKNEHDTASAPPQVAAGTPAAPGACCRSCLPPPLPRRPEIPLVLTPAGRSARRRRIYWPQPDHFSRPGCVGYGFGTFPPGCSYEPCRHHGTPGAVRADLPLPHRHCAFALVARLVVGPKPWGLIHSVAGRLRRSLLLPYLALSFAVLRHLLRRDAGVERCEPAWNTIIFNLHRLNFGFMAMMLLLVPVQCYAEELAYRGFMMQMLAAGPHPGCRLCCPPSVHALPRLRPLGSGTILAMGIYAGFSAGTPAV